MAFKQYDTKKKRPQLIALIDMAFILLLFFLVSSLVAQLTKREQKLSLPTPENKSGRAQILIQLLDKNNFIYLDQDFSSTVHAIEINYEFLPDRAQRNMMIDALMQKTFSKVQLIEKLSEKMESARNNPEQRYFILIRCLEQIYYYHLIDIIKSISGLPNVNYGCVGGSLEDFKKASSISTREEIDQNGIRRDNLVIKFSE